MTNLEFYYFELLKNAVQEKYLETHSPSYEDISKWKGIDIVYFQEELRQKAKGNISEKSFYTYFKNNNSEKLPRIDMLNILSLYIGNKSWSDFKKQHQKIVENPVEQNKQIVPEPTPEHTNPTKEVSDNQAVEEIINNSTKKTSFVRQYLWLGISAILFILVILLTFSDKLFYKKYTYTFIDADRNTGIKDKLDIKILREKESPILFRVMPNSPFVYETKSKNLKMIISSPFYRTDTVIRDLTAAPEAENIELKPNDYSIQLYYYSKSIKDFKQKTTQLNRLISDNALIYQVVDSDIYGIETMDKQKYISLVTLPTTSLENLEVIDSQMKNGKIVMIKFRITNDEKAK